MKESFDDFLRKILQDDSQKKVENIKQLFESTDKEISKVLEICRSFTQRSETDFSCDTSNWFKILRIFYKMELRIKDFLIKKEEEIEVQKLMQEKISSLFESMSYVSSIQFVIKV